MKIQPINKERVKIAFLLFVYIIFYLIAFFLLEQRKVPISMIMSDIDHMIPFCEYFIVPYLFWFISLGLTGAYFLLFCDDVNETKKLMDTFMTGMSVFIIFSLFFPNGHALRPTLTDDSIFMEMVGFLYKIDTSTNVFPSMHVFCTVAMAIALLRQEKLLKIKGFKITVLTISSLIVLSTCFLKQHSIIDVAGAVMLNLACYQLFYNSKIKEVMMRIRQNILAFVHRRGGL